MRYEWSSTSIFIHKNDDKRIVNEYGVLKFDKRKPKQLDFLFIELQWSC